MATHHARSLIAALALGAAVTVSGCTAGSGSSSNSPATVDGSGSDSGAAAPQGTGAQGAQDDGRTRPGGSGTGDSGSGSGSGSGDSGGVRWCTTDALSVSLRPGQPAAGNRYAALVLTNSSSAACRTQGWPGLQLTGEDGEKIPTEAVRDRSVPSRPLTLSPGGHASARLHWTVVPGEGDPADGRCPDPATLRVIPPDQRTAKSAPWKMGEVCGAGEIDVRPLLPGADLPE